MTAPRCLWPSATAVLMNSQHVKTATGVLVRIVGALTSDECFTHHQLGTFNVTKIERHVRRKLIDFNLCKVPLSKEIIEHSLGRDIDDATLKNMPIPRIYDPCLAIEDGELTYIADGAHRIIRLAELRMDHFYAWVITLQTAQAFRVTFQQRVAGVWTQIASAELPAMMGGGIDVNAAE